MRALSAGILALSVGAGALGQQIVAIQELPNAQASYVSGVSADGTTVIGYAQLTSQQRAWRWRGGTGVVELPPIPNDNRSAAYGVSSNGWVVVGASMSPLFESHAVVWGTSGQPQNIGTLMPGTDAGANAVSADGLVVAGWSGPPFLERAFRWTGAGGMQELGTISDFSVAAGVDATGSVVVGSSGNEDGFGRPLRWTSFGGWANQNLGALPGENFCAARCVSGNGTVVAGNCVSAGRAMPFRWSSAQGMQPLPMWPFQSVSVNAMSQDGSIVVGTATLPAGLDRAFLWSDSTGMVDLNQYLPTRGVNLAGWTLREAWGVSASGLVIAGNGLYQGLYRPFVAYLGQAPCYANCDGSTAAPVLNVADFTCFLQRFAAGSPQANCDGSTAPPVLNVADFTCFLQRFAGGCL
jgi:probable HAF family extracellular repeat protein